MRDDPLLEAPVCPYYCEENVWQLCDPARLGGRNASALFITNEHATVAVAHQRAGGEQGLVVWDYHVVLLLEAPAWVHDVDSTLDTPIDAATWLRQSFGASAGHPSFAPRFCSLPAAHYRERFFSTRAHMRSEGGSWRHAPPPWPALDQPRPDVIELDALRGMDPRFEWLDFADLMARVRV